jgi:cell wall assembly regulator SMI1
MRVNTSDLIYQGEKSGLHNWNTFSGTSFYWHPDWLHIAEDMTGHKALEKIDTPKGAATKADAENAILKHLNK